MFQKEKVQIIRIPQDTTGVQRLFLKLKIWKLSVTSKFIMLHEKRSVLNTKRNKNQLIQTIYASRIKSSRSSNLLPQLHKLSSSSQSCEHLVDFSDADTPHAPLQILDKASIKPNSMYVKLANSHEPFIYLQSIP